MPSVLLDTGPLVALFKQNDTHYVRAKSWFRSQRGPLLTTHAVLTEAWHLLSTPARLPMARFANVACEICEFDGDDRARILSVLERYADLPMDYADATLIVVAETRKINFVSTIDVKDFSVYRLANGRSLQLVF